MLSENLIIQLMHPGTEHTKDENIEDTNLGLKYWNTDNHKRKFIRSNGMFVDKNNKLYNSVLDFWGEWEPESIVLDSDKKKCNYTCQYPQYIHYPLYIPPEIRKRNKSLNNINIQNTDPFVFGDRFYYTCCMQKKISQLGGIKQGSVIIFASRVGSAEKYKLLIDTVFVVKDAFSLSDKEKVKEIKQKNPIFYHTVIELLNSRQGHKSGGCTKKSDNDYFDFRIFVGASYEDSNGTEPYCFFPCKCSDENKGYERFESKNHMFAKLPQGFGYIKNISSTNLWNQIKDECIKENYNLGIKAELPQSVQSLDANNLLKFVNNVNDKIDKNYNN